MGHERFALWSKLEEPFCQSGQVPLAADPNSVVFQSIVRGNSARSAEAMVIQGKADPLLALRAYIYRGRLREASALADELVRVARTPIESAEILLEQARILALSAEWEECESVSGRALALPEIAPVSQLTLLQIRALARFEKHRMAEAVADLAQIDSLATIFPNSPSAFYAALLRARIIARDRDPRSGRAELERLWSGLLGNPNANLDRVHALIRADLDVGRLEGRACPMRLLASFRIAEITGEDLYVALGALEAAYSGIGVLRAYFSPMLKAAARDFPRVRKLLAELEGSGEGTVSGAAIASAARTPGEIDEAGLRRFVSALPKTGEIFLKSQGVLIHLSPFAIQPFAEHPQLRKAVAALEDGVAPLDIFFRQVWGRQKFSAHLHAGLISSLLYRLRKKTGLLARAASGSVWLENTLVIE